MAENDSNIRNHITNAQAGMDLDNSINQIPKGKLSYALNANVENFDENSISYQNEQGNELCFDFPEGYRYIGGHFIPEINKHIYFLIGPNGESEIGYVENNNCKYITYINADCLNFNINHPILKAVHKITNCSAEIYWTDGYNQRRFLDLNTPPYKIDEGVNICNDKTTSEIDCNKLNIQPDFSIPELSITDVISGGNLTAGTVQFAIQYSDSQGGAYTSYYSITNPTPIADNRITTTEFNYPVGKSVVLNIKNLDTTGYFKYYNLAVIKTVNNITSAELIGTYYIDTKETTIVYSGQNQTQIELTINDIFEKFPYYEIAQDVTSVQDILVWDQLTSLDRINYQQIANKIHLQWQSYRIPNSENYANELNATNLRGYLRDEVYPFEIAFLLKNGKQTDGFHIPGRILSATESLYPAIPTSNDDFIGIPEIGNISPYWKIYNTATITETDTAYTPHSDYKGPYQSGEFAYWESLEKYPCNEEIWGELANQPIRHHKFPDVNISPIFENPIIELAGDGKYTNLAIQKNAIFPIGVKINTQEIQLLITQSSLSQSEKDNIIGFKILRGNRDVNKSIVAKGILRNVGKYNREGTDYYFPNYPYNDLREDPFLLEKSNRFSDQCQSYEIATTVSAANYQYTDCISGVLTGADLLFGERVTVCSMTTPVLNPSNAGTITPLSYDTYILTATYTTFSIFGNFAAFRYIDFQTKETHDITLNVSESNPTNSLTVQVPVGFLPVTLGYSGAGYSIQLTTNTEESACYPEQLNAFNTDDSKYRHVFNSPETSFGQPFLGTILKIENVLFGAGKGHFVQVEKNALYKLLTKEAQQDALKSSAELANITTDFNASAMFQAYQAYLEIYRNGITKLNYAWSYNSILDYDYWAKVENGLGIKQRNLEIAQYLYPGVQSVNDNININNYQRESSIYLKTDSTKSPLPYPSQTPALTNGAGMSFVEDKSRYINSEQDCSAPEKQFDISSVVYYGSIKNSVPNQWGQIYSYETIDTGFQEIFTEEDLFNSSTKILFGGDTFINPFSFKTKLPFFIDNRVGAPDESDIYYDEIGNIAYPEFWHSARNVLYDYDATADGGTVMKNIISVKAHHLDCPNNQYPAPDSTVDPPITNPNRTFYGGKMYLFAYGIPTFYVESSINVDLRQAFNNREGDFYPHVSTGIPDSWLQETRVPIVQDNTYYYNVTYSKQNKENFFSHLPVNWTGDECFTNFPFRAIYSDEQKDYTDNVSNNWLIYRPISKFDFPQNYGSLTSLDGIQNKAILARFENKSLLYGTMLTINTSNPQAAYLGNDSLFTSSPPIDFAETDLGYMGSQHKFLLKIPQGQVSVDAKRGQIFLISGNDSSDISAFGSGMNHFLLNHLPFEIEKFFPGIDTDNHFKGIGLHGVYDNRYKRILISKLDYLPLSEEIKYNYDTQEFYVNISLNNVIFPKIIELSDVEYFCNKSWTISYNLNTGSWISFHSYIPNFYIAENNFFYSGLNESCDLEAIAAEIVFECELEGEAEKKFCDLQGNVQLLNPDCDLVGTAEYV